MTGSDVGQLTIFSRPLSEAEVGRKWPLNVKSVNCELKCPAFISEEMEGGYMYLCIDTDYRSRDDNSTNTLFSASPDNLFQYYLSVASTSYLYWSEGEEGP